jgi:hypothetical protein
VGGGRLVEAAEQSFVRGESGNLLSVAEQESISAP